MRRRMEAKHCVGEKAVQSRPRAIPIVGELRVSAIPGDSILLPLADIFAGNVLEHVY